ncbi:MAG: diguanylate cyclase [Bryobacteraceae bacterium]|jgi:two-component system cell cycle response regulator
MPFDRAMTAAVDPLALPQHGRHTRVLAAEDNPVFQSMLRSMLTKWGYDPIIARDGAEAWRVLAAEDAPRLAILDWMMPGLDGVEICRRVRASGREPYIYILLLTARTESQDLVEGMEAGADDYLTKPFIAHELRVRLRAGQRILDLQTELVAAREALRVQATHDSLTGIANRSGILDSLHTGLARASRDRRPVAVLMADVDCFKQINDTRGHQAGDEVLRELAHRMKSAMRSYDAVGRYGGEEFLVVLPGCDGAGALAQAERIRSVIGGEPFRAGGSVFGITCSLGISWRDPASPEDADALISEADLALYNAKARGRNRVESHAPVLAEA